MNLHSGNGSALIENGAGGLPVALPPSLAADDTSAAAPADGVLVWAEARRLIEETVLSENKIASRLGIKRSTLSSRRVREGWTRPAGAPKGVVDKRHSETTRQEARRLFQETTLSTKEIAARLGVGRTTITNWAKREGWSRPKGAPRWGGDGHDPRALAVRLCRAMGRQVDKIEVRLDDPKTDADEKDARILGTLAKT